MMIEVLKSKIHCARVTEANLNYMGSITIDEDLLDAANMIAGEKVYIADNNNGERFETYIIKGERGSGKICLNGAAARKVQPDDIIIIMSYALMDFEEAKSFKPSVIFPEFRLPNKVVDVEIENLAKMGVNFIKDCIIGKTISVEQLEEEGFKGVFVASGAGLPNFMNIPGENSINILSSNEYLTRVNLMDAASEDSDTPVPFGRNVAVIGGGNTAMDSVRTARRLGAERAMIIYRRSEEEMPARIEEVKHAKEEGVEFLTLHNPIEYIADEQGKVKQVILQKMELGEPDASGRRSPVAIPGATETIDIDLAIVSVGVSPNPIVPSSIPGLEMGRKGTIAVNENMQSSIPTIYAGGDIVRGGATVILAMGDGRKAAASMHEQLSK